MLITQLWSVQSLTHDMPSKDGSSQVWTLLSTSHQAICKLTHCLSQFLEIQISSEITRGGCHLTVSEITSSPWTLSQTQ